jgi:hypothetical protein
MRRALKWQLYVTCYTLLFGVPLLTAPNEVLPLLGLAPTREPWVRLVGMFLLSLSYLSYAIYRERAVAMLFYSITVSAFILAVLLVLAHSGPPPILYAAAAIVGVGVVGSTVSYVRERGPVAMRSTSTDR